MTSVVILDRWEMAGRTPVVLEHTIHNNTQYNQTPYSTNNNQNQMAGLALDISKNKTGVNLNRRDMAGRWLGGCPWRFPKIAGVILDHYTMAGR